MGPPKACLAYPGVLLVLPVSGCDRQSSSSISISGMEYSEAVNEPEKWLMTYSSEKKVCFCPGSLNGDLSQCGVL